MKYQIQPPTKYTFILVLVFLSITTQSNAQHWPYIFKTSITIEPTMEIRELSIDSAKAENGELLFVIDADDLVPVILWNYTNDAQKTLSTDSSGLASLGTQKGVFSCEIMLLLTSFSVKIKTRPGMRYIISLRYRAANPLPTMYTIYSKWPIWNKKQIKACLKEQKGAKCINARHQHILMELNG